MVSSVSNSAAQQSTQHALQIQQKKQRDDEQRNVRNNQQPSPQNTQHSASAEQKQSRPEAQNSQQAKGAALDVRA